jgi:spermidine synthase
VRLRLVYLTVFVIAACGLGYELVAGALSSYLLGDSITQFSIAIGLYLFALGIGAWLSKFVEGKLAARFVDIELAVAFAGGTSAAVLFLAFERGVWFRPILYGEILLVGALVGLEIPLLLRLLKDELEFKDLVAHVLTFDYVGALVVSLVFPLVLVPTLGVVRSALAFGLVNAIVALWSTWIFGERLPRPGFLRVRSGVVIALLVAGIALSEHLTRHTEETVYGDDIVLARTTRYQRLVVTRNAAGFQLYLNGGLQFSSVDEYRYHEALVHPAFAVHAAFEEGSAAPSSTHRSSASSTASESASPAIAAANDGEIGRSQGAARRVLVLGGGDGLALREIEKHREVESITLVDIDPAMVELATSFEPLHDLNADSFADPRVHVVHDDAMRWLEERRGLFDVVIVDFPDPNNFSVGKLYTSTFYERVCANLASDGVLAVQSTSPLFSRRAYWCIDRTIEACGLFARPYHAFVPSFGEWGFVLASRHAFDVPGAKERDEDGAVLDRARVVRDGERRSDFEVQAASRIDERNDDLDRSRAIRSNAAAAGVGHIRECLPAGLRFLDAPTMSSLFQLSPDMSALPVEENRLNTQVLVRYYEDDWRKLN